VTVQNFGPPVTACAQISKCPVGKKNYSSHLDKFYIENHCKLASAKVSICFTHYVAVTMLTMTKYSNRMQTQL